MRFVRGLEIPYLSLSSCLSHCLIGKKSETFNILVDYGFPKMQNSLNL